MANSDNMPPASDAAKQPTAPMVGVWESRSATIEPGVTRPRSVMTRCEMPAPPSAVSMPCERKNCCQRLLPAAIAAVGAGEP